MKHPHREDWVPYLFGETDPEVKKELARHLNACPECAEELRGWRKSLQRLDVWKAPQPAHRRLPVFSPVFNLAAAAVLVLGIGLGLGRWFSPPAAQLHSGLESSLKATLIPELRQQLRQELAGAFQSQLNQFQTESSNSLARLKTELAQASAADTAQALEQVVAALRSERAEDSQAVATALDELRKEHQAALVSLRKDLETVASFADDEIRAARVKLIELAALNAVGENNP